MRTFNIIFSLFALIVWVAISFILTRPGEHEGNRISINASWDFETTVPLTFKAGGVDTFYFRNEDGEVVALGQPEEIPAGWTDDNYFVAKGELQPGIYEVEGSPNIRFQAGDNQVTTVREFKRDGYVTMIILIGAVALVIWVAVMTFPRN